MDPTTQNRTPGLLAWLHNPGVPTLIVTLVVVFYAAAILLQNDGDPLSFIEYDGHFSYQIAVRFFESPKNIASLPDDYQYRDDVPTAYRYQRILYPTLARLLAFGQTNLIPWTLIILNILAISGGTYITEKILAELGVSRWYALIYGFYGSQFVGLRTDLNEPLAHALIQVAILAWMRRRLLWTVVFFALAALTKEIALIFLGAFIVSELIKRDLKWVIGLAAGAVPYFAFQFFLLFWRGEFGVTSGQPFHLLPFGGWLEAAEINVLAFILISIPIIPMTIFPILAGFYLGLKSLKNKLYHPFVFSMIFFGLFILFLPFLTFSESVAMLRVTQGLAISILLYGALVDSGRVLNYSFFWLATNVLIIKGVPA
ncbi:MAG: hypothetical protein WAM60_05010 [Candidatus Promineifilaceae bacterium]